MASAAPEAPPVSMKQLLEAGVHFGHQTQRWNPRMSPYIFGARNGIHIVDLQKTVRMFADAFNFVLRTVSDGGSVLFVGTKKQAQDIVAEEARRGGQFHVTNRWLGGTLTNFKTVKGSIDRLKTLEKMQTDGSHERLPKKEVIKLERERVKLERNLGGIKDMGRLPSVMFVIDPRKEQIAVKEANKLGITVVAVVDTNCDPQEIDYVIPGNDDAIRAIKLFSGRIADACLEGSAKHQEFLASRPKPEEKEEAPKDKPSKTKLPGGPEVEIVRRATDTDESAEAAEGAEAAAAEAAAAEGETTEAGESAPVADADAEAKAAAEA